MKFVVDIRGRCNEDFYEFFIKGPILSCYSPLLLSSLLKHQVLDVKFTVESTSALTSFCHIIVPFSLSFRVTKIFIFHADFSYVSHEDLLDYGAWDFSSILIIIIFIYFSFLIQIKWKLKFFTLIISYLTWYSM